MNNDFQRIVTMDNSVTKDIDYIFFYHVITFRDIDYMRRSDRM